MKQLTRSRARGMSQDELKIRAGDAEHADSARVADDEMRRRFRAAQDRDRRQREHLDEVDQEIPYATEADYGCDELHREMSLAVLITRSRDGDAIAERELRRRNVVEDLKRRRRDAKRDDVSVEQISDDGLGGREVLEAAGLEPVDGFDESSAPKPLGSIDIQPSWTRQLEVCLALFVDATEDGKQAARQELERMAKAAELAVKHESAIRDAEQLSDRLVTLNRVYSAVGPAQVLLEKAAKAFLSGSPCDDHSPEAIAGVLSDGLARLESYALGEDPDDVDRPDDPPDSIETVGAR